MTGEAGVGKSYLAFVLALLLDKKFGVDQIVYTYSDYMRLLRGLPMGRVIVFDEPSYAMGKRDWYKQINKVLVQTIESQRFKVHPLIIPIINKSLLLGIKIEIKMRANIKIIKDWTRNIIG